MRTGQGSILQSLRAVRDFLDANARRLGSVIDTGARRKLDEAIADLDAHASAQSGSYIAERGATQQKRALMETLRRDHMAPIARIAAAQLPRSAEVQPLRMPGVRLATEQLAAAATAMVDTASRFSETFISAGLPADFAAQVKAAVEAMLDAAGGRMRSRGQRRGATEGLKVKLSEGRRIVAVLDAFVQKALKDDPSLLADWDVVKRVQRSSSRAAAPSPVPDAPVAGQAGGAA